MPIVRIVVEHTVEQVTLLDVSEDELENLTYEDAVASCPYDELQPSVVDSVITSATICGEEYYF